MKFFNGTVKSWSEIEGFGTIQVDNMDELVWAHFSHIADYGPGGFRSLEVGDRVAVSFEEAEQDGYHYRAVEITTKREER